MLLLPVEGMTCASCVTRVEKALNKVPGVQEANVEPCHRGRRVFSSIGLPLALMPPPPRAQLSAAVEKAGYTLGPERATQLAHRPSPEAATPSDRADRSARTSAPARKTDDLRRKSARQPRGGPWR